MTAELKNVWSPAHQAVEDGDVVELARLLDAGVDPNEICCGMTLLTHAVDYEADTAIQAGHEMEVTLIAILLAYGASPRIMGNEGKDPIGLADEYQHSAARRLLERFM
ncbi:ankyrin repeat domain-containing protein [Streptomyces chartreusis]|uniref:ankyrin repeat domain-containing protein n=1 Tax=Streptomyces chartreusis TaxID=1969 RepID=UPI00386BF1F1|nr:ankyrin repeat domain-containing protein [Streptomyces chartreusis]